MKKVKSGATKRREAAAAREVITKYPKLTQFLKPAVEAGSESVPTETNDEAIVNVQIDSVSSNNLASVGDGTMDTCKSISNATTLPLLFLSDDLSDWPDNVSDAQRCDIVDPGVKKLKLVFHTTKKDGILQ